MGQTIPMAATARDYEISANAVPETILREIDTQLKDLAELGFHSPQFSMATTRKVKHIEACNVSLLHNTGELLAHISYSKATAFHPPILRVFVSIESLIEGGSSVTTTSTSRQMDPVSGERVWYHPGKPGRELFEAHRQQLRCIPGLAIKPVGSLFDLWATLEDSHQKVLSERLARGVWREVAPAPDPIEPATTSATPPPLPDNPDDPVFTELEKLQKGSKGWGPAVVVFGVTLVLFLAAGFWQWNWQFAAMLVPILLFHELGHYLTMRLFGYQNLRIFFIPFFGAAVTGLRLNAPGWQQAIVALAGPIPGILVGWGLLVAAQHADSYWLERFGRLFVIINGFNLLPILPLDGGRVLGALVFARNRWLEAAAVVAAAAGLVVLCYLGMGRIFLFLGFFMLFSISRVWRLAGITALVRANGFSPDAPAARSISREAARAILAEVKASQSPKIPLSPRAMAQMVISIYERLHTRAPGGLVVVALLAVHGTALGAAAFLGLQTFTPRYQTPWMPERVYKSVESTLVCQRATHIHFDGLASLGSARQTVDD